LPPLESIEIVRDKILDKTLFRLEGGNLAVTPASFGTNSAI
jgi:hypothetical protein